MKNLVPTISREKRDTTFSSELKKEKEKKKKILSMFIIFYHFITMHNSKKIFRLIELKRKLINYLFIVIILCN